MSINRGFLEGRNPSQLFRPEPATEPGVSGIESLDVDPDLRRGCIPACRFQGYGTGCEGRRVDSGEFDPGVHRADREGRILEIKRLRLTQESDELVSGYASAGSIRDNGGDFNLHDPFRASQTIYDQPGRNRVYAFQPLADSLVDIVPVGAVCNINLYTADMT